MSTFAIVAVAIAVLLGVIWLAASLAGAIQRIKELTAEIYDTSRFINRQHAAWEDMTEFGSLDLITAVQLTKELENKRMELEMTLNEPRH